MTAATAVKEHPILFSGAMIRAILAGTKMQTRRVMKPQPDHCHRDIIGKRAPWSKDDWNRLLPQVGDKQISCPYGIPGDRLWVRETHAILSIADDRPEAGVGYRADHPYGGDLSKGDGGYNWRWFEDESRDKAARVVDADRWRPSIFMPRWASRITLEVTDVRVQRVQEISEEDATAEGIQSFDFPVPPNPPDQVQRMYGTSAYFPQTEPTAAKAFARLWREINDKRTGCAWSDNPWTWAITFRRIA